MNYDPNLTYCGRDATQTVRIVFGIWEYRKTIEVGVGGNCLGFDVIEAAIDAFYDKLFYESDSVPKLVLIHPVTGTELLHEDDEDRGPDWLRKLVISVEIVNIK